MLDEAALLAHAGRGGRAGKHAGVDADHADPAAVEQTEPGDHGVAGDVLGDPALGQREPADLEPGSRLDQHVDALAHRQPAGCAVPAQALGTAHLQGALATLAQLGDPVGHRAAGSRAGPGWGVNAVECHRTSGRGWTALPGREVDYQTADW
jgi:hypothetical protein